MLYCTAMQAGHEPPLRLLVTFMYMSSSTQFTALGEALKWMSLSLTVWLQVSTQMLLIDTMPQHAIGSSSQDCIMR